MSNEINNEPKLQLATKYGLSNNQKTFKDITQKPEFKEIIESFDLKGIFKEPKKADVVEDKVVLSEAINQLSSSLKEINSTEQNIVNISKAKDNNIFRS